MELAIVISAVTLALAFVAWRVVATVRVAKGGHGGGCEKCPAARQ